MGPPCGKPPTKAGKLRHEATETGSHGATEARSHPPKRASCGTKPRRLEATEPRRHEATKTQTMDHLAGEGSSGGWVLRAPTQRLDGAKVDRNSGRRSSW